MATSSDQPLALRDPIAGLNSILDLYNGKTTVQDISGTTTTQAGETNTSSTKSNLTPDQIQTQIDAAMAPLNAASHAAGLSTYNDTSLALGRAQAAADVAAKYAGTTTTSTVGPKVTTTDPRTVTTSTPGALAPSRIGSTLSGLAQTALINPILSKAQKSSTVQNAISSVTDPIGAMADNILNPVDSSATGGENAIVRQAMGGLDASGNVANYAADATTNAVANAATDTGTTIATNAITDAGAQTVADTGTQTAVDTGTAAATGATSGAGDLVASAGNAISNAASSASDWISSFFAEGGLVKKPSNSFADGGQVSAAGMDGGDDSDGYATGGYIDRFVAPTNITNQSDQTPVQMANGDVAPPTPAPAAGATDNNPISNIPSVGDTATANLISQITGKGGPSVAQSDSAATSASKPSLGSYGPTIGDISPANLGISALGLMGPIGTLASSVISAVTGTTGIAPMLANTLGIGAQPGEADPAAANPTPTNDALTGFLALNNNFDTNPAPDTTTPANTGGNTGTNTGGGFGANAGDAGGVGGNTGGTASAAEGGTISGPGTSTSDSIPTNLSDGEYVIDAKTVQALGPEFFQKIQAMFNPEAIASQRAKGRI